MKSIKVGPLFSAVVGSLGALLVYAREKLHDIAYTYAQRTGLIYCAAHGATPAVHTDTIYAVCNQRPTAMTSGAFTASGMDYVAVGQVESFPVIGSKRSSNVFTPIRGSKTKGKGSSDYGGGDMVMADLPTDAGQVILKAIEAQSEGGSMKITYGDGEAHYIYFHAMSWQLSQAQEGAFMKRTCEIQVLDTVVVVAA